MIKKCKVCAKPLTFKRRYKYCTYLGCTEYNKKLRRYDVVRQNEKPKTEEE